MCARSASDRQTGTVGDLAIAAATASLLATACPVGLRGRAAGSAECGDRVFCTAALGTCHGVRTVRSGRARLLAPTVG